MNSTGQTRPADFRQRASQHLEDLARRVDRLVPSHRDPERFHLEKSEVAAELRRLAYAADRRSPVQ